MIGSMGYNRRPRESLSLTLFIVTKKSPVSFSMSKTEVDPSLTFSLPTIMKQSLISVLISSVCTKTGTHFFWENSVNYARVSPVAHPLTKKQRIALLLFQS